MVANRTYLRDTLQRVVDGGDITNEELYEAIPEPLHLSKLELGAWERLSHWADDGDIRASEPGYAEDQRERMRYWIARLDGYSSEEIEWGEHVATHIPMWGCFLIVALVSGGVYLLLR